MESARRHRQYSRWDGTQEIYDVSAEEYFDEMSDTLLYHGDVAGALRELLSKGFRDPKGRDVQGISELMKKLRQRREEMLSRYGMSQTYQDIANAIEEVLEIENAALALEAERGDQRATIQSMELANLPRQLPDKLKALQSYDFTSPAAKDRFDELITKLRDDILTSAFSQMKEALGSYSPEDLQRLSQMMGELNDLIERHRSGEDVSLDFEAFKAKYQDLLPPVSSLEELLEYLVSQAEAMSAFMNSLDPTQRAELEEMFSMVMGDLDLAWQMDRLSQNMSGMRPQSGRRFGFRGSDPMPLSEAGDVFAELGSIDDLEAALSDLTGPGSLSEMDFDAVEKLLGKDASESLKKLSQVARELEEAGLISRHEGYLKMTPRGLRRVGMKALEELFRGIDADVIGQHRGVRSGEGTDVDYQTRPYTFGDPFNLSVKETIRNALARQGGGLPVKLSPEDFEIESTEALVACSTVLLLDLSLSMPLRDNFLPAKKMAMALSSLIASRFPRDYFGLIGFSEIARELSVAALPGASWDYVYGTNLEHALMLGRKLLSQRDGYKQIILVTDGEPTAHILDDGEVFFSYPPAPETLRATLAEVKRCTMEKITINTFVLDVNEYLRSFIERLSAVNRGKVFYVDSNNLGDYVLVDFLRSRKAAFGE